MSCTYMRQQDFGMKNMTPNEYLITTARVYGTCKDRLDFILDLVRPFFPVNTETSENGDTIVSLDPFNNVPLKELSGGQRRMISIATALFQESRVLLLDEPLSGIDSASSEKITDLLKTFAKDKSMIVLMTLHQVRRLMFISLFSRVLVQILMALNLSHHFYTHAHADNHLLALG